MSREGWQTCLACGEEHPLDSFKKTLEEFEAQRYNRFYSKVSSFCYPCRRKADTKTGTLASPEPIQVCQTCGLRFPLSSFVNKKGKLLEWCKVCRAKFVGARHLPINRDLGGGPRI